MRSTRLLAAAQAHNIVQSRFDPIAAFIYKMHVSQAGHVNPHLLPRLTRQPQPQLSLHPSQRPHNVSHAPPLPVIWHRNNAIVRMRLRAIRKVRMPQRVRSRDAIGWIETQHSRDQVQQRVAEQPRPRALSEMGEQAVLKGRGRHELRSNVVGGVAVGAVSKV